jgi:hypothetical protein
MSMSMICRRCKYADGYDDDDYLHCRRHAPIVTRRQRDEARYTEDLYTTWPRVAPDWWCGDWEEKPRC